MLSNKRRKESGRKDVKRNNKIELRPRGGEGDRSNLISTRRKEEKRKKKRSTLMVVNKKHCEIKDVRKEREMEIRV